MQFKPVSRDKFALPDNMIVFQEFDDTGRHRLVIGEHEYDSAGYCFIATAETPYGMFAGTTDYYSGTLPRVFEIRSGQLVKP